MLVRRVVSAPFGAACIAVLLFVGLTAWQGIGLPRDSRTYLDVAEDLRDGRGFSDPDYEDAVHFPPGTSLAIAAIASTGLDPVDAALVLNALSWLVALAGVAALYATAGGRRGPLEWGLLLWVVVGGTISLLYGSVLSEGPFLAVCVLALVAAERWVQRPSVAGAAVTWALCALSVAFRYVGIAVVAAVALRIVQQRWGWRRAVPAIVLVGTSVLPVALWYLEYRSYSGSAVTLASGRSFQLGNLFHSLGALAAVFVGGLPYSERSTVLFEPVDPLVRAGLAVVGAAIVVGAVVGTLAIARARSGGRGPVASLVGLVAAARARGCLTAVNYAASSVALLVVWRFTTGYHILARYWLVALLPLVAVTAAWLSRRSPSSVPNIVRRSAPALVGLFLVTHAVVSVRLLVG